MLEVQEYRLIYNWKDIEERPNFLPEITINNEEEAIDNLSHIIAPYQFRDKVKCGISRCKTKHNYGFLVKLKTGKEIIIGKDCGKKYFGAEFKAQYKLMNTLRTESENFKILEEKFLLINELKDNYEKITLFAGKHGIHKILQTIKQLSTANESLNYWTVADIPQNITNSGDIWMNIRKTEQEIENERRLRVESQGNIYDATSSQGEIKIDLYRREKIAKVECFEIIYKAYEIENLIKYFSSIHRTLKHPRDMKKEDRKKLVKEFRAYEQNMHEINDFCLKGNKLLAYDNILKIENAIKDNVAKKEFRNWAAQFM
ncbi:hypothetical protein [Acinetobacter pittii]|uniref:hypothetical protein n=1 Tax=Acinetobacter pittii TaxID=48296 RepID=UPI002A09684D|nr:hypothetical protein [Acinetobacter pittii]MDX8164207.1 hypothetical protein [Acinetobacter pittii]